MPGTLCLLLLTLPAAFATAQTTSLPDRILRYSADRQSLESTYTVRASSLP